MKSSGGAGRADQLSHRYRKKHPWKMSDLLFAIRELMRLFITGRNCEAERLVDQAAKQLTDDRLMLTNLYPA